MFLLVVEYIPMELNVVEPKAVTSVWLFEIQILGLEEFLKKDVATRWSVMEGH